MNKKQFLTALEKELHFLNAPDRSDVLTYYDEMIQDAVEQGQLELDVINRLDPVQDIASALKGGDGLMQKIKQHASIPLAQAVNTTVRLIAQIIFIAVLFTLGTIAFSLGVTGIALIFQAILRLLNGSVEATFRLFVMGQALMGLGLLLLGIGMFHWLFERAKAVFTKILEWLRSILSKEEV